MKPTGIEKQVCQDIAKRQKLGIEKYGTTVADNPLTLREWLQHTYEESLDKAIYLKRAIAELEALQPSVELLERHNEWRRGGEGEATDPRSLGQALDEIVQALKNN
jgi:hypothetical protein